MPPARRGVPVCGVLGEERGVMRLTRDQKRELKRCVCSVDNEHDQLFSVCGLRCEATYHTHWWIVAEIAEDDRFRAAEERA